MLGLCSIGQLLVDLWEVIFMSDIANEQKNGDSPRTYKGGERLLLGCEANIFGTLTFGPIVLNQDPQLGKVLFKDAATMGKKIRVS